MKLRTTVKFFSSFVEKNLNKDSKSFNDNPVLNNVFHKMQEKIAQEKIKIKFLPDDKKPKAADQKELNHILEETKEIRVNFSAY